MLKSIADKLAVSGIFIADEVPIATGTCGDDHGDTPRSISAAACCYPLLWGCGTPLDTINHVLALAF